LSNLSDVGKDFLEVLDCETLLGNDVYPREMAVGTGDELLVKSAVDEVVFEGKDAFFPPRVEDLIRGAEDRSIGLIRSLLTTNPMVLFKDTEMGQGSLTSPQEVLEVQRACCNVPCSGKGDDRRRALGGSWWVAARKQRWLQGDDSEDLGVGFLGIEPRRYLSNVASQLDYSGESDCLVRLGRRWGRPVFSDYRGVFVEEMWEFLARKRLWGCLRVVWEVARYFFSKYLATNSSKVRYASSRNRFCNTTLSRVVNSEWDQSTTPSGVGGGIWSIATDAHL
ncbi:hypothetical protein EDB84DRAFT_1447623, partial [Lactarius hengduanensis]